MLKKFFLVLATLGTLGTLFSEETQEVQVPSTKYLFVLYDAGETLALKGVLEKMEQDKADFRGRFWHCRND
jgi:hypothetical protein